MVEYKVLTTILPSGTNTATFTDALIGSETKIDVYTTNDDTIIENQEQSGTTVTITVSNHSDALGVALVINNVEEYEPYNDDAIIQAINDLTNRVLNNEVDIESINQDISTLGGMVTDLDTEVKTLGTSKQDKLTPGENISIVNNVISASGGGVDIYDDVERVVGTFLGKPLYRKIIKVENASGLPRNTTLTLLDVEGLEDSFLLFANAYRINGQYYQLPLDDNSFNSRISIKPNGVFIGSDYSGGTFIITKIIACYLYTKVGD